MSSRKAIATVVTAFIVALLAGTVMGVGLARQAQPTDRHSMLAQELGLSAAQSAQMKEIWSRVVQVGPGARERSRELRRQRDEAIEKLIAPEQRAAYDRIKQDYTTAVAALDQERKEAFQEAVKKTNQILTEAQRKKYEEIRRRWEERHGREDRTATTRGAANRGR
jgi:Spy/CpxP family protein refolding chaperone